MQASLITESIVPQNESLLSPSKNKLFYCDISRFGVTWWARIQAAPVSASDSPIPHFPQIRISLPGTRDMSEHTEHLGSSPGTPAVQERERIKLQLPRHKAVIPHCHTHTSHRTHWHIKQNICFLACWWIIAAIF